MLVDFAEKNGQRELDCSINSKQDAENICECDKRFAENIAVVQQECVADSKSSTEKGDNCLDEVYRTKTGGGTFDHKTMCDKSHVGHDKNKCCGIYPNRYPYDSEHKDCCQQKSIDSFGNVFTDFVLEKGDGRCEEEGGTVVFSVEGSPHTYINANQNWALTT